MAKIAEKIPYKQCEKEFNEYGYELITTENDYKNSREKVTIVDKDGYYGVISYNVFKYDHAFKSMSTHNPYTIQNIKRYIEINNLGAILLSKKYNELDDKLKFKCFCGNDFEVSWHHFKCANQTKCRVCNVESYREKRLNSEEDLCRALNSNECILFKGEYISNKSRLHLMDKDGYKGVTCYSRLDRGQYPAKFHALNPYTIENIKNYIKLNNLDCKLLSTKYKNNKTEKLKFKCNCGETFECSLDYFIRCKKTRCDKCMKNESNIELKTEYWLKENNIQFIFQYRIDKCKYKRALPFDFAVFKNTNLIGLIEVDGQQHDEVDTHFFSKNKTDKEKLESQLRDKIKTNYCKDNNIPLLRLKQFYFQSDRYIRELKLFMFEEA